MPHFILDCSTDIFEQHDTQHVMQVVFETARQCGLFRPDDIKVRVRSFSDFVTGGTGDRFMLVFAYIMEGRSVTQKAALSESIVAALTGLFPDVPVISMNVMDFEKSTYHNRDTIS